ncbi:basic salivary proline-rich protein 1-like [Anastrepha obliqua]|uniref:basic salivary proline-rich protein 1-like n=1 Tax=Anastrepha obliqua TaxID=95512 RepID=UPI002409453E|nr:basic salivary proline-rich protein 1-like [Anastrepha obliqua]
MKLHFLFVLIISALVGTLMAAAPSGPPPSGPPPSGRPPRGPPPSGRPPPPKNSTSSSG